MKVVRILFGSVLSGGLIGIGATAYIAAPDIVSGALFFTVGLFAICFFGLDLFTGRSGYLITRPGRLSYAAELLLIWAGNFAGAAAYSAALRFAKPNLAQKMAELWSGKLTQHPFAVFLLGVGCGLLIYIAVDNYRNSGSDVGKAVGILLCVPAFILCGFEHCIADMVYMTAAGKFDILFILIVTCGNMAGSFLIPLYSLVKAKAQGS